MALSESEGLLRIAAADLETAIASTDPAVFREGAWGFWLQQAVEKALKAWLLHLHGDDPPLSHDLRRLLRLLAAVDPEASDWNDLGALTVYFAMTPIPLRWGSTGSLTTSGRVSCFSTWMKSCGGRRNHRITAARNCPAMAAQQAGQWTAHLPQRVAATTITTTRYQPWIEAFLVGGETA